MKTKVLLFDIEISPIVGYTWGMYNSDVLQVKDDYQILCFSYKWLGQKRVHVVAQCDFGDYEGKNDDKNVVKRLHELFSEADIVIAHNASFDVKRSQARMMVHKLLPPAPFVVVDTLKMAKKVGGFSSNRLKDLVSRLNIGTKLESGGIETLMGVLNGDCLSWRKLKVYCKRDTEILEKLYLELRPWCSVPSMSVMNDKPTSCPKCNSLHLRASGYYATKTGKRKRYQCLSCGGWCHGRKIYRDNELKYIP